MKRRTFVAILSLASVAATFQKVAADGLIERAPPEGGWATYKFETLTSELGGPLTLVNTSQATIRALGSKSVDGEPCRWVEVEYQIVLSPRGGSKKSAGVFTTIQRILLPEKSLAAGQDPLAAVVELWQREGVGEELSQSAKSRDVQSQTEGFLARVLCGPSDDTQDLPEAVVATGVGALPCRTVKTTHSTKAQSRGMDVVDVRTFTIHRSDKAVFGVASLESDIVQSSPAGLNTRRVYRLTLAEQATDSKQPVE